MCLCVCVCTRGCLFVCVLRTNNFVLKHCLGIFMVCFDFRMFFSVNCRYSFISLTLSHSLSVYTNESIDMCILCVMQ